MEFEKFKKYRKIAFIIIGCAFVIYSIYMFRQLNNETNNNSISEVEVAPDDYNALFKEATKGDLVLNKTFLFGKRNPVSLFIYNKNYSLEVTKINAETNLSLKNDLKEEYGKTDISGNTVYVPFHEKDLEVSYKSSSNGEASKISLVLNGDSVSINKSNNIAYYYLKAKSISISYDADNTKDIYIESKRILPLGVEKPVAFMFIKKDRFIYFILMTPNSPESTSSLQDLSSLMK